MPIIDIIYTSILVTALLLALIGRASQNLRSAVAGAAILFSLAWQIYAWQINLKTEQIAQSFMQEQNASSSAIHAYPTLLQPWLRRVTVETKSQIYIGSYSPLIDEEIDWRIFEKETHPLIAQMKKKERYKIFEWFALNQVFWRVKDLGEGLEIEAHDLRYMASTERLQGLWGVRARFDKEGRMVGRVERFTNRDAADVATILRDITKRTFGFSSSASSRRQAQFLHKPSPRQE